MKKFLLLLGIVSTLTMGAYQMIPEQVSIGSSKPDASASLHLTGVTKGFIPNKMTTAQRNAIPSPANGLMIYNTNLDELQLYNGVGWITVGAGGAGGVDAWATATVYAVDDVVIFNQELYLCQNNHTSGVFATDLANGEWLIISDDVSSTGTITDTAIPRYVGTSGNVIDSSGVTIDNSNNIAGASSLAIGGSLDTSSILDAVSTSKGTRPCPSMSEVQRDAIVTPATGLCIFNNTTNTLNIYNGTAWVSAGGGLSSWETAKPYKIGDIVIESKQIYRALTNHTSGTFATDLAASRWEALPQELKTDSNVQFANLNATGTTTLNSGLTGPLKASSGVVSSSAVDLTSEVTGTLPIANGGTGSATQNFVDLTTNQTVAGEKTFSNTLKSDSIQTTGSSGVVIKNSSGTTVADFGTANTTNASIAGGLNTGGNIAATGTVTGSNLSGTNTGDTEIGNDAGNIGVAKEFDFPNSQVVQTDSTNKKFRIESGNNNELYNGGFEADALAIGWTISNATSSSSTTSIEGSKSLSLALTGALSLSQSSTINAAQKSGVQMVASVWVNSSLNDVTVCALVGGAEQHCTSAPSNGQWKQVIIPFIGNSTSNGIKVKTTSSTSGTVLVDSAFVGLSAPFQNVSGAKLVGTATWASATSCTWSTTSATFVDPSANASCNNPTVTGGVTAPGTKVPKVVITDAQPGSYYFVATGGFYKASGAQGQIRFSDGTLSTNAMQNAVTGAASFTGMVAGTIIRTTQASNWTVGVQLAANGTTHQIENDTPSLYEDFQIAVYYFPPESKIYSQASQDYAYTNAGTITIGATTTAPTKGTVVTDRIMASRKGQNLIAEYQYEQSSAGSAGSGDYLFTLPSGLSFDSSIVFFSTGTAASTATAKSVVGYGKITEGTTASYNVQLIAYDSTRFRVATTIYGTPNAGIFHNSTTYNFANNPLAFDFKLNAPISGWQDYGVIVGSFEGIEKCATANECNDTFSAGINSSGTVYTQNTPWIETASWSPTGQLNVTFKSGIFTVTPMCWAIPSITGQRMTINTNSSSSVSFLNRSNDGTGNVNTDANVFCQKQGVDYKPKTAKVATSIGVPTVPGVTTQAIDTFSVSYGKTAATACDSTGLVNTNQCAYLDQIGNAVTSVTRSGTGVYSLNTSKTYSKLKCSLGGSEAAGVDNPIVNKSLQCLNCSSISISTVGRTSGNGIDTNGTIMCQGSY